MIIWYHLLKQTRCFCHLCCHVNTHTSCKEVKKAAFQVRVTRSPVLSEKCCLMSRCSSSIGVRSFYMSRDNPSARPRYTMLLAKKNPSAV